MQETSLYEPVKRFLETMDFTVKGEIGGCDVVGVRAGEPPVVVICELKLQFNLELVLQAVDRAAACDEVWLAALMSARGKGREHDRRFRALCRRLGFGLLGVGSKAMWSCCSARPPCRRAATRDGARAWSRSITVARAIRRSAAARARSRS